MTFPQKKVLRLRDETYGEGLFDCWRNAPGDCAGSIIKKKGMETQKTGLNFLEEKVKLLGVKGTCERLSNYAADILKAAPDSSEIQEAVDFLMFLRLDVIKGRFFEAKKEG